MTTSLPWITDRLPTRADGDKYGDVIRLLPDRLTWCVDHWGEIEPDQPWLPFPPPAAKPTAATQADANTTCDLAGLAVHDHLTPPPELVREWYDASRGPRCEYELATQAARWGADQELEACCEWLPSDLTINGESLRTARRPKPPNLVEQALAELAATERCYPADYSTIRRALERLQRLEQENHD